MGFGFQWVRPPAVLQRGIREYGERVMVAVAAVADYVGQKMQAEARRDAPWTDRTGNARSGLFAAVTREAAHDLVVLYLSHGHTVYYGKFLELAHGKRYAILMPTIERNLPELERMLKGLFR